MKALPFKIRTLRVSIKGRSYTQYQVNGTINGERIRKTYADRAEAEAEKQQQEIIRKNNLRNFRVISHLSDEQVHDAEAAIKLLSGRKAGLAECARYYLENYRGTEQAPAMADAIKDYLDQRARDFERKAITRRQHRAIGFEMRRFLLAFDGRTVSAVSSDAVKTYLEADKPGLKTWNNRRGYLSTFFRHCINHDWILLNPVDKLPTYNLKRARSMAETLTAQQAADLMAFVETFNGGRMVNYFSLALFAGLRPDWKDGEMSRFQPDFINWETNMIVLPPAATKTNEKRKIPLSPTLRAWLTRYPLESYPAIPTGCRDLRLEIRKKFTLGHDVLRHTFISMLVARDRSIGDAALAAGNTESIIRKHYLDLKSREEAEKFWAVVPLATAEKVIAFSA